jgi:hypothetical protein
MHILYDVSFILTCLQFEYYLHTYNSNCLHNTIMTNIKFCNKSSCWFQLNFPYLGLFPGKETWAHSLPPNYKPCVCPILAVRFKLSFGCLNLTALFCLSCPCSPISSFCDCIYIVLLFTSIECTTITHDFSLPLLLFSTCSRHSHEIRTCVYSSLIFRSDTDSHLTIVSQMVANSK